MMTTNNNQQRIEEVYEHMWSQNSGNLMDRLNESLHPRSSAMLYERAAELDINSQYHVLDAGSGLGIYSCGLAQRFGCHVTGIDIAENNLTRANERNQSMSLTDLVTFQQGNIESLPFAAAIFDLIWCRDMLVHVRNLPQAFKEFARVLKPTGTVLIHNTFATDLLEPKEAAHLYSVLDNVAENMSAAFFEEALQTAGLTIRTREIIGSEWIEYNEEQEHRSSNELLQLARMRRNQAKLVAEFGQGVFDVTQSVFLWHVYLLLGKLSSTIYTLRKA